MIPIFARRFLSLSLRLGLVALAIVVWREQRRGAARQQGAPPAQSADVPPQAATPLEREVATGAVPAMAPAHESTVPVEDFEAEGLDVPGIPGVTAEPAEPAAPEGEVETEAIDVPGIPGAIAEPVEPAAPEGEGEAAALDVPGIPGASAEPIEPAAPEGQVEAPDVPGLPGATTQPAGAPDDLARLHGIGPKMAAVLHAAGITTFAQLAATEPAGLEAILRAAGMRLANFATWPEQAALAAAGNWDALAELQASLRRARR